MPQRHSASEGCPRGVTIPNSLYFAIDDLFELHGRHGSVQKHSVNEEPRGPAYAGLVFHHTRVICITAVPLTHSTRIKPPKTYGDPEITFCALV
jgi:hypothetical protein